MKKISTLNDMPTTLVEAWRANPSLAALDLLYEPLDKNQENRCDIMPIQRVVLNRNWQATSAITVACRGFGKTYLIAVSAILTAMLYPGRRVGTLSASFRQAKLVFEEIRNIWHASPILQACTQRAPVLANDSCRLEFNTVHGHRPSVIVALPLASGDKIRGSRFHLVCTDELCQIPEIVYNTVIRPFGSTSQEPTKQVRRYEKIQEIKISSLYTEEEKRDLIAALEASNQQNQLWGFTSGYYAHNWVYGLYKKFSNRMNNIRSDDDDLGTEYTDDPIDYATFQIPWNALPKKFLSTKGLRDARRDMNAIMFAMEYCAAWISDSGGFFSIGEIDACKAENRDIKFNMRASGDPNKRYIMSIDPARTSDAFAIIISELDPELGLKVCHIEQHFKQPTPKMVDLIHKMLYRFPSTIAIGMDRGGGGQTVADYLAQGDGFEPILDKDDDRYRGLPGRRILTLIDFSSAWIENANHNAKFLLERQKVLFPSPSLEGATTSTRLDELDKDYQLIKQLIMQLVSIQVTETRTGRAHFDLPETGGGFVKHKDLYSSFLIASDMYFNMIQDSIIPARRMAPLGILIPTDGMSGLW